MLRVESNHPADSREKAQKNGSVRTELKWDREMVFPAQGIARPQLLRQIDIRYTQNHDVYLGEAEYMSRQMVGEREI